MKQVLQATSEYQSCNIARQRGPLGSEQSLGPRRMSPNAQIHHDIMHARRLGLRNSLSHEFSRWCRYIPRVQNDNTLWQTRRGPKRIDESLDIHEKPSLLYIKFRPDLACYLPCSIISCCACIALLCETSSSSHFSISILQHCASARTPGL